MSKIIQLITTNENPQVAQCARWLCEQSKKGSIHSVIILTLGPGMQFEAVHAGHAPRFVDTFVGHLITIAPVLRSQEGDPNA